MWKFPEFAGHCGQQTLVHNISPEFNLKRSPTMESPEVPLEQAQEEIAHHAHAAAEPWIMGVALTAALLAVCAAITSLMAEHYANEAMIEQIQCSDQWSYYQAKGIKASVLDTKLELRRGLGRPEAPEDLAKLEEYGKEQRGIREKAEEYQRESNQHLRVHHALAPAVTMFQVAIAVAAISVLTRRRLFWLAAIAFGIAGVGFFVYGTLFLPPAAAAQLTLSRSFGILLG
jgi:hypothetical protein